MSHSRLLGACDPYPANHSPCRPSCDDPGPRNPSDPGPWSRVGVCPPQASCRFRMTRRSAQYHPQKTRTMATFDVLSPSQRSLPSQQWPISHLRSANRQMESRMDGPRVSRIDRTVSARSLLVTASRSLLYIRTCAHKVLLRRVKVRTAPIVFEHRTNGTLPVPTDWGSNTATHNKGPHVRPFRQQLSRTRVPGRQRWVNIRNLLCCQRFDQECNAAQALA